MNDVKTFRHGAAVALSEVERLILEWEVREENVNALVAEAEEELEEVQAKLDDRREWVTEAEQAQRDLQDALRLLRSVDKLTERALQDW